MKMLTFQCLQPDQDNIQTGRQREMVKFLKEIGVKDARSLSNLDFLEHKIHVNQIAKLLKPAQSRIFLDFFSIYSEKIDSPRPLADGSRNYNSRHQSTSKTKFYLDPVPTISKRKWSLDQNIFICKTIHNIIKTRCSSP